MSGHSTEEEVMELSLDVDSNDHVLPSDLDDYDYDYDACTNTNSVVDQEVLGIAVRVQGNFTDSCSDSGNSSDGNSDDDFYMQLQHIAQNFPDKPMTLVPSPAEYDEDFYNDWTLQVKPAKSHIGFRPLKKKQANQTSKYLLSVSQYFNMTSHLSDIIIRSCLFFDLAATILYFIGFNLQFSPSQ